jgi:hypothetical protein
MSDIKNTTPIATAVAMSAQDVESQEPKEVMEEHTTTPMIEYDDNAGKGMGIAMFVLIIVGFVSAFFLPYISSACYIAALVLASILTCGCCCAKQYKLKPGVKKMATATLITLILLFIVSTIGAVKLIQSIMDTYDPTTGTISEDSINVYAKMLLPAAIIMYILIVWRSSSLVSLLGVVVNVFMTSMDTTYPYICRENVFSSVVVWLKIYSCDCTS